MESVKRLEYLLLRPKGFHLFTDHRNLADKLQRWAMVLTAYRYVIEHISGENNMGADILSRWKTTELVKTPVSRLNVLAVVPPVFPLMNPDFQWPVLKEITSLQQSTDRTDAVPWAEERSCYVIFGDKVWIPPTAEDLMERIRVIGHAGGSGHRSQSATLQAIKAWCWWESMEADVKSFVKPYGPALHATKPNEVLHFDYLALPEDEDTHSKYVLVIKDDFSGFVELIPCTAADSSTCAHGLLQWFQRLVCVSDQGAHFKNAVIDTLALRRRSHQHDGNLCQTALNHQPADGLGNRATVTVFTCLPAVTPLSIVFTMDGIVIELIKDEHFREVASALEAMQREVAETSDRRRRHARDRRAAKAKEAFFSDGDSVLAANVIEYPNKLAIKCQGPKRIVNCVSDWIFEAQDLLEPLTIKTHHASCLRFYTEQHHDITEDLVQHALHTQGGHLVEAFEGIWLNSWLGLDKLENTWEPYTSLHTDVPVLLQRYCDQHEGDPAFTRMLAAHDCAGIGRRPRGSTQILRARN
ncbi:hypothetical protein PHMEG_00011292 [Phytophthora megakarya]|uniref:Integrase zinc-binding domain-containing protein n=1 Tax=Phytophthora megakarya TaxID=4795 RepID=A0A225WBL6_9STRA|nr:hypothetical protein PHMEG_00011292 [Phytophthora megakarya]